MGCDYDWPDGGPSAYYHPDFPPRKRAKRRGVNMECGCKVIHNPDVAIEGYHEINFCSLHAAAPQMLETLKEIVAVISAFARAAATPTKE